MSTLEPGATVAGRYRVERVLGAGGMGTVYEVVRLDFGGRFALKVLRGELARDATLAERFRREARAAAAIGHPHIVQVVDVGELDGGAPFLVLELLRGATLGEVLEREGPLPVERAVRIALSCCDALDAAHDAGVVHRDLKPDNVFLVEGAAAPDFVKVLDFGTAKLLSPALAGGTLTREGAFVGTPFYMSPEQLDGDEALDARTDVYALGVLLHQMLAGRVPFAHERFSQLVRAITTEPPPPLRALRPEVPAVLEAIVLRALAKQPADRFPGMAAVAAALRAAARTTAEEARDSGRPPARAATEEAREIVVARPAESPGRSSVHVAATAALVALVLGGAAVVLGTRGPAQATGAGRTARAGRDSPAHEALATGAAPPASGAPAALAIDAGRDPAGARPAAPAPLPGPARPDHGVRSAAAGARHHEAPSGRRVITLRNELEAAVSIALSCTQSGPHGAAVPAFGAVTVSVAAGEECVVRCSSALGLPRCPVVLHASSRSVVARR